MSARQLCTFAVGPLVVGVDVSCVQEVRRDDVVVPVPLAPPSVAGIVNLRGQIVSVIDARARFGLPPSAAAGVHAVIHNAGEAVSLAVDAERDVIDVDDDAIEPTPDTVDASIAGLITGVHQLDGALLLVLDPDRILTVT